MLNDYVAMQWAHMRYEEMLRERKDEQKMHLITTPKGNKKTQAEAEITAPEVEAEQS